MGPIAIAPGTHRAPGGEATPGGSGARGFAEPDLLPVPLPAGAVLIYNSAIRHRGGANRSKRRPQLTGARRAMLGPAREPRPAVAPPGCSPVRGQLGRPPYLALSAPA